MIAIGRKLLGAALITLGLVTTVAHAVTPLSYATTWTGPDGKGWSLRFSGSADGGTVSGVFSANSMQFDVTAVVTGSSLSGSLKQQGRAIGTFSASRSPDGSVSGSFMAGTKTTPWRIPAAAAPPWPSSGQ